MATLPLGLSDALLDGFVGQFYSETDAVRDLLGGAHEDEFSFKPRSQPLLLPQIVVVGQESSGKSSVLESLAMLPLFPRDTQICTRLPIHLKMRRQPDTNATATATATVSADATPPQIRMRLVFADGRPPIESQQQFTADQVAPLMKQWMDDIIARESMDAGVSKGVVDHVLEIHVTSPLVPTLDLVDLPGIVAGRLANEPHDMMEQTRALVEKYLKMPHTLVLAVVPAGERVRNSQAFQLVQQFGLVDRTIGVLTMVDRAGDPTDPRGPFAELKAKLDGEAGDLVALEPHGYVAVKNRDTRLPESQQLPLLTFKAHELEWFDVNMSGYVERGLASSGVLAVKVERMLVKHVKEKWVPQTIKQFNDLLETAKDRAKNLGERPQDVVRDFKGQAQDAQLAFLRKTFDKAFTKGVVDCVDGVVVSLARTLLKKITAKRGGFREDHSLMRDVQMHSLVEKMMQRDELGEGLRELLPRAITSAFLRLALLVAEALPQTSKHDDLNLRRFENLHLLAASSMWERVKALIADKARLADQIVQALESNLIGDDTKLARDFDCDDMFEVDPAVERLVNMLYTEHKMQETVPLPLEEYFIPVVASVSARAQLLKPNPSKFGGSTASATVTSSLFSGLSASEIRNSLAHAAECGEVECSSQRCAEILRLARHACGSVVEIDCTDCNLLRALTRHHIHVCQHWPPRSKPSVTCVVCTWHQRLSPASAVATSGSQPPSATSSMKSSGFSIGAAPESPDHKTPRGRRPSGNLAGLPAAKSPKPQEKQEQTPPVREKEPASRSPPTARGGPRWTTKPPETGSLMPRFGRRRYYHQENQYAKPDTDQEELRRLVEVLSRFVVAPLVRQLMDVRALRRIAVDYLTTHPLATTDVDASHWFAENCAKERQELLSEQRRLQAACDGLQGFE